MDLYWVLAQNKSKLKHNPWTECKYLNNKIK